jgi:biopolymer transport protein ExbB
MIPILLFSIVAVTVFLERLWMLRRRKVLPYEDLREVEVLIHGQQFSDARAICQQNHSPLAQIVHAALQYRAASRQVIQEKMVGRGKASAMKLRKGIGLLQTIASVSPLLGLLGTVGGMIKVFDAISMGGVGDPGSLATGIAEALITTAAGLCVAIPTFLGQRYLSNRAGKFIHGLEDYAGHLLDLITGNYPEESEGEEWTSKKAST